MKRIKKLFRYDPPEYGRLELLLIRLALALVIYFGFFFDIAHDQQRVPNGLAQWFNFAPIGDKENFVLLKHILGVALVFYVAGVAPLISTGYVLFLMVAIGTLRNSQGNIHHGTQIVTMAVLGQYIAYIWHSWKGARSGKWKIFGLASLESHQMATNLAIQTAVAGYVAAGICKVDAMHVMWIWDSPLLSMQVLKIGHQHFYSFLDPAPLEHAERMAALLTNYPNLTRLVMGTGLIVELGAFLALFNRTMCFVMGVSLYVMHYFIGLIMQLGFPLNEWILLIYFVNFPFFIVALLRALKIYDDRPAGAKLAGEASAAS